MNLFLFSYFFLALALFILAAPYLIYLSFRSKYKKAIPARFFMINNPPLHAQDVWFHVCSLGEAGSLEPLIAHLKPAQMAITTTTQTGYDRARKLVSQVRFLPFEVWLPFWIRRHKVVVVLEAELWWMLFWMSQKKGAKTVLLNARISDKSYKTYQKMGWFYRRLFQNVDKVFCQTPTDKVRLEELGARDVTVIGNIKLAKKVEAHHLLPKPAKEMIVAASTHEKEESLILEAMPFGDAAVLVVVPRHPERFEAVHKLLEAFAQTRKLAYHRYSQTPNFEADIVLVDTLGLLIDIYAISDTVILGGAFEPIGGHNPLEPAAFRNKIISGTHYFNQMSLFPLVEHLVEVQSKDLKSVLEHRAEIPVARINGEVNMQPFYDYIATHTKAQP